MLTRANKNRCLSLACVVAMLSASPLVLADVVGSKPDYSLFPKLRFEVELDKSRKEDFYSLDFDSYTPASTFNSKGLFSQRDLLLDQYDATLYYPLRSQEMSLDLGINMKYITGQASFIQDGKYYVHNFRAALPMISATALFDLPFKGLTAGFEGKRYVELESNTTGFDYKAKLNYQFSRGFGLEGGWQHQQYSLDNADQTTTDIEQKGPFLDFYLRF